MRQTDTSLLDWRDSANTSHDGVNAFFDPLLYQDGKYAVAQPVTGEPIEPFHFAGNAGLRHPHILGRLLRDLNTAGLHQLMSDTPMRRSSHHAVTRAARR